MRWARNRESIQLSASDLIGHLNCRHLTGLDIAVANAVLERPKIWDPSLEILRERGARHEQGYIEHLRKSGHAVTFIDGVGVDQAAVSQTIKAMRAGSDIIVVAGWIAPFVSEANIADAGAHVGELRAGGIFSSRLNLSAN